MNKQQQDYIRKQNALRTEPAKPIKRAEAPADRASNDAPDKAPPGKSSSRSGGAGKNKE